MNPSSPRLASRRALEKDMDNLIRAFGLPGVLYAIVEVCYHRSGESPAWGLIGRDLTLIEAQASRLLGEG